jgi:hypothetical protein
MLKLTDLLLTCGLNLPPVKELDEIKSDNEITLT